MEIIEENSNLSVYIVSLKPLDEDSSKKVEEIIRNSPEFIGVSEMNGDSYFLLVASEESEELIRDIIVDYREIGAVYTEDAESSDGFEWLVKNNESLDMVEYLSYRDLFSENNDEPQSLEKEVNREEQVINTPFSIDSSIIKENDYQNDDSHQISQYLDDLTLDGNIQSDKEQDTNKNLIEESIDEESILREKIHQVSNLVDVMIGNILPSKEEIESSLSTKLDSEPQNKFMMCMKMQQEDALMLAKSLLVDDLSHLETIDMEHLRKHVEDMIESNQLSSYGDYADAYEILKNEENLVIEEIQKSKVQYENDFNAWIADIIAEKRREYETLYPPINEKDFWSLHEDKLNELEESLGELTNQIRNEIIAKSDGRINLRGLKAFYRLQMIKKQLKKRYIEAEKEFNEMMNEPKYFSPITLEKDKRDSYEVINLNYREDDLNQFTDSDEIGFASSDILTSSYNDALAAAKADEEYDESDEYEDEDEEDYDESDEDEDEDENENENENYNESENESDEDEYEYEDEYEDEEDYDESDEDEEDYDESDEDEEDYDESDEEYDESENESDEDNDKSDEDESDGDYEIDVDKEYNGESGEFESKSNEPDDLEVDFTRVSLLDGVIDESEKNENNQDTQETQEEDHQAVNFTRFNGEALKSDDSVPSFEDDIIEPHKEEVKKKKKSKLKKVIIFTIISLVVLGLLGAGGYYIYDNYSGLKSEPSVTRSKTQKNNPEVEKIQSNFKRGDRMEVVVDEGLIPVKIVDFNESGAVAEDSSGKQWLITNELLKQWIENHPEQFKKSSKESNDKSKESNDKSKDSKESK